MKAYSWCQAKARISTIAISFSSILSVLDNTEEYKEKEWKYMKKEETKVHFASNMKKEETKSILQVIWLLQNNRTH